MKLRLNFTNDHRMTIPLSIIIQNSDKIIYINFVQFLYTSYASIKVGKNLEYTYNGIVVNLKKKINLTICNNVDKSRRHDAT